MSNRKLVTIALSFFFTGCLVTRQEIRESAKGESLSAEQQRRANAEVRLQEVDEQIRHMTGRIETLENNLNITNKDKNESTMSWRNEQSVIQEKLKIFEEALSKLEEQSVMIAKKIEALQVAQATSSTKDSKSSSTKGSFDSAESDFSKKKWKEAIVSFEKYRSSYPSGKHYGEATYKIGAAFNELGMRVEAKAFYSEVVEKFPKSDWAKKAKQRLKALE
ncbi:MAG: hypothetical protein A2Z20_05665 [Bdellovibrionales bacterium RBG_16_40_8]|nr:MAG: hypothetical protein A2Z20_05665 [Bdellovibrionales bacterium RBG_16_40_8]